MDSTKMDSKQAGDKTHARRLTPADTLLWRALAYKSGYFARKGMLDTDGSFYYDDARLAQENGVTAKTVMRSKRRLQEMGKIKYQSGKYKGSATKYWILVKGDIWSSFALNPEPDILSAKPDISSVKAGHPVTPISNNLKKKDCSQKKEMTDEKEKEGRDAFRKCIQDLKRKSGSVT